MSEIPKSELKHLADYLRRKSLKMALDAGKSGSHLGGGLSLIEVFATLYGSILKFDAKNPFDENRDRLVVPLLTCLINIVCRQRYGYLGWFVLYKLCDHEPQEQQ